jgi:hypothetical protein
MIFGGLVSDLGTKGIYRTFRPLLLLLSQFVRKKKPEKVFVMVAVKKNPR